MKNSWLPVALVALFCGCSGDSPTETQINPDSAPRVTSKVTLYPPQLDGYVRFSDGTFAPFGTWVRIYRDGEPPEGDAEDQTDGGHYGFSGPDEGWPTGWYFIITDTVYRESLPYIGYRNSYHEEGVWTRNQNITLNRVYNQSSPTQ